MNYRHAYHAGNFADVFKHVVLVALLESLLRKESAFCYLDTHAGRGRYDLSSEAAQKSKESEGGILRVLQATHLPELVQRYVGCLEEKEGRTYPGSPCFAKRLLRPHDRIVLCELQPEEYQQLKQTFPHDKQVAIHHQDGYLALKAFLPPKERRGLVLIDPPYEKSDELSQLSKALSAAVHRWETGVYALWYPIKEARSTQRFLQSLKQKINRPLLVTELSIYPENTATHLNGSGMLIVNPPWQLDETLKTALPGLWQTLSPKKQGRHRVEML
jgi:23S rRNA (adenine2030-N6)-methyltransferase